MQVYLPAKCVKSLHLEKKNPSEEWAEEPNSADYRMP